MKRTPYIETSVISYLKARPSRDMVVAAYQEVTHEWWRHALARFDLVASQLVVAEAGSSVPEAAEVRLKMLKAISLLDAIPEAENLAQALVDLEAFPRQAAEDAAHRHCRDQRRGFSGNVGYCQYSDAHKNRAHMPTGGL